MKKKEPEKIFFKGNSITKVSFKLSSLDAKTSFNIIKYYLKKRFKYNLDLQIMINPEVTKMYINKSNAVPKNIAKSFDCNEFKNITPVFTYELNPTFIDSLDSCLPNELYIEYSFIKNVFYQCLKPEDKAILLFYIFKNTQLSFFDEELKIYQKKFDNMQARDRREKFYIGIEALIDNIKIVERI